MSTDKPMKLVDGKLLPLTDDEIEQRKKDQAEWEKNNPPEPVAEPEEKPHGKRRSK